VPFLFATAVQSVIAPLVLAIIISTMHTAPRASAFLSLDGAILESLREIKWPPLRQTLSFSPCFSIEL
jgi:hypothetical protein